MADNRLSQAILEIESGNKETAQGLLAVVLRQDPNNADAWRWMAIALDDPDKKRQCWQRVLGLKPDDEQAARGLASLQAQRAVIPEPPAPEKTTKKEVLVAGFASDQRGLFNKGQVVSFLGALGLILGAVLPWVTGSAPFLGTITKAGYEGDGIITGAIGALLLLGSLLYRGKPGRLYSIASSVFGLIAGGILLFDLINASSVVAGFESELATISIGSGLYVSLLGSFIAIVGGLVKLPKEEVALAAQVPQVRLVKKAKKRTDLIVGLVIAGVVAVVSVSLVGIWWAIDSGLLQLESSVPTETLAPTQTPTSIPTWTPTPTPTTKADALRYMADLLPIIGTINDALATNAALWELALDDTSVAYDPEWQAQVREVALTILDANERLRQVAPPDSLLMAHNEFLLYADRMDSSMEYLLRWLDDQEDYILMERSMTEAEQAMEHFNQATGFLSTLVE